MPAGQRIGYIPKGQRGEGGFFGLHLPSSMFAYYSWARLIGYWAQAGHTPATRALDKYIVGNKSDVISPQAKLYWGIFETLAFSLVSSVSFFAEKKHLKRNIYDAIAAERGMRPEDVGIFSMYKSNNPFLRTLRDRFTLQQGTRIPAALAFAYNVTVGVFAITFNFTLERSMFLENNAYDILRNMIYEVQQLRISGNQDRDRVFAGLERGVQRTLTENHRPQMTEKEMLANKEVFARLTENIMSQRFSVPEAIYILGAIANHKEPGVLLSEIEKIERLGIKGFALQKSIHGNEKSPVQQIVERGRQPVGPTAPAGMAL